MVETARLGFDGDGQVYRVDELESNISPKLAQDTPDGKLEVEPIAVTRLGGTVPWDTESAQLDCGETVTGSNGEQSQRVVYKAVVDKERLETIAAMRRNANTLRLVSAAYSGTITFDELKWDRIRDANGAVVRGEGDNAGPFYEIQLQTKDDGETES